MELVELRAFLHETKWNGARVVPFERIDEFATELTLRRIRLPVADTFDFMFFCLEGLRLGTLDACSFLAGMKGNPFGGENVGRSRRGGFLFNHVPIFSGGVS